MLWYFFRAHRALPRTLIGSWGGVLREGVVAGLIGAAVVAVWFLAIDAIQGEPLRTPKLLGMALLRQSAPTAAVLSYTVVHGLDRKSTRLNSSHTVISYAVFCLKK